MRTNKTTDQELNECELRNIALTNENTELRMQLNHKLNEEYDKTKQLEAQLEAAKQANKRLTEELCEWTCLECRAEYYGPSAVEKGSFKCLSPSCKGRYCVPKKFLGSLDKVGDTDIVKQIEDSLKKAA